MAVGMTLGGVECARGSRPGFVALGSGSFLRIYPLTTTYWRSWGDRDAGLHRATPAASPCSVGCGLCACGGSPPAHHQELRSILDAFVLIFAIVWSSPQGRGAASGLCESLL